MWQRNEGHGGSWPRRDGVRINVFEEKLDKKDAAIKANQEKMNARIETVQEQMEAKIKTHLEEMNTTESEANQGKTGAMAEHCNWTSCAKATHMLTALWDQAYGVVHGAPKRPTFEKR
jgi:hypothetical protein